MGLVHEWKEVKMSYKDVDKETMEYFDKIFGLDPMFFSKVPNTKSAQEVQREQCKGKTIVEILNNEWRKK